MQTTSFFELQSRDNERGISFSIQNLNITCATKFKFLSSPTSSSQATSFSETSPSNSPTTLTPDDSFNRKLKKLKEISHDEIYMRDSVPLFEGSRHSHDEKISRKLGFHDIEDIGDILAKTGTNWKASHFRHLVFDRSLSAKVFYGHLIRTYNSLREILKHKPPKDLPLRKKSQEVSCFRLMGIKSLFFELEGTLVKEMPSEEGSDFTIDCYDVLGKLSRKYYKKRPFLDEMLTFLLQHFEIYLFTSLIGPIAYQIANKLDPNDQIFSDILFNYHCFKTVDGRIIKDLRVISNKNLKNVLLIDSNAMSFGFQRENGIPILPWEGDSNDRELKYLVFYLMKIHDADDIREANDAQLRLNELVRTEKQDLIGMIKGL